MSDTVKNILLHGLGQNASAWDGTASVIGGSCVCPCMFQWFSSDTEVSYAMLYEKLEAFCGQFGEPLNLCGLSLGGVLALQYTVMHPENVCKLALIGVPYTMPKKLLKFQNMLFRLMPDSAFRDAGISKRDMINLCKDMAELDFRSRLKEISCPVLVLCGERDKANKSSASAFDRELSNSELFIMPRAGHEVNIDAPTELGKKLKTFWE